MNKFYHILSFVLPLALTFASCSDESDEWRLTPAQKDLIGTAVNFQPYISDFNTSSRVGEPGPVYNGGFNRGDMMYIYRQYADGSGNFAYPSDPSKTLPGTIYKYTAMTYGETNIFQKSSWKPYEGKKFSMKDGDYSYTMPKAITKADSIIWENGSTVRFRCWTLSSLSNNLSGDSYTVVYPDYSVCDWVTVSGPTENIPMNMRHLGCRLAFAPYGGNSFVNSDQFRIQITYDPADYMRDDNADTDDEDAADKAESLEKATEMAAAVKAAYEKMCFPAGVDMNDFSLLACENGSDKAPYTGKTHQHGANEMTADYIATSIRRPEFLSYAGGYNYMVSVPYDMSKENDGKNITLPPYTRFKVYLRDVNQGDKLHGQAESDYHIFVLSDVMKRDGSGNTISSEHPFADGLTLKAGYSYQFYVGYYYDGITVTAADNFSWTQQDLEAANAIYDQTDAPEKETFGWWHDAIDQAVERVQKGTEKNYNPVFYIANEQQYQELIDLVNGNFTYNGKLPVGEQIHKYRHVDSKTKEVTIQWYVGEPVKDAAGTHYAWITQEEAEEQGFIFYNRYYPSDADRDAYSEIDVLDAPYSFFDTDVQRRFTVNLTADLDLHDWPLESIGKSEETAFAGNFDAQGYTISNVYVRKSGSNNQLFGYAKDGIIKNLRVVSTHPMSIVGTCDTERILGCSVIAPSTTGAIAERAIGTCYFVGCIHVGNTTKPLVTEGDYFYMYGCMQAASGITGGALCGVTSGFSTDFVKPQGEFTELKDVYWNNFACNYYDTTLSPSAVAVTGATWMDEENKTIVYNRRQYIRGSSTNILCAKNDNLVDVTAEWDKFKDTQRAALYGLAPWRAMNYGIKKYNDGVNDLNKCQMHYENNTTGYIHRYPVLLPEVPGAGQWEDVNEVYN